MPAVKLNHASARSWTADLPAVFGFGSQISGRLWQHKKEGAFAALSVLLGQRPRRRLGIQQCAADLDLAAGGQSRSTARIKHAQLSVHGSQPIVVRIDEYDGASIGGFQAQTSVAHCDCAPKRCEGIDKGFVRIRRTSEPYGLRVDRRLDVTAGCHCDRA